MADDWPDEWVSGTEKIASNASSGSQQDSARFTNDHGILYLVGTHKKGEWMFTEDTLPPHLENNP